MEKILLVDENPETRKRLRHYLRDAGYTFFETENGEAALEEVKKNLPDVVLLNEMMPDMSGSEVCQRLRAIPQNDLLYIIMLIDATDGEQRTYGLEHEVDDYVTKPVNLDEVLDRIRLGLRTIKKKRSAAIDALNELYNREFFHLYLVQEVERTRRYRRQLSLIFVEIDHFNNINATCGYLVGDTVLIEVSKILLLHCRLTDIPVRWGGEKFAILLPETGLEGTSALAERMRQAIETHQFEDVPSMTASFGVASLKNDEQDLLIRADSALHNAKKGGRNRVVSSE